MSYRIVISSFAAVAIGVSCIATDASARGGGGGGGGGGSRLGGTAPGVRSSITGPTGGAGYFAAPGVRSSITGPAGGGGYFAASGVRSIPRTTGVGGPAGGGGKFFRITGVGGPTVTGAAGATGGGVAAGALYYAPASYDSNAACGRYPYPPCNKVPTR
jgi:hypothetical protein